MYLELLKDRRNPEVPYRVLSKELEVYLVGIEKICDRMRTERKTINRYFYVRDVDKKHARRSVE